MDKRKILLLVMFSLILMPSAYALSFDPVVDVIGDLGDFIQGIFNSPDAQVFVFFILLFIVVYAALDVALSKVKVFEGKDRQRKMFAVAMGFLTDFALFLATSPREFVARMLTFAGPFGGILLGIIAFLAIYKALDIQESNKKWPRVLMALGVGFIVAGMLMGPDYDVLVTIGFILLVIGIIGLISALGGGGSSDSPDSPDRPSPNNPDRPQPTPKPNQPDNPDDKNNQGLDLSQTGKIRVLVTDGDTNPIKNATVKITPANGKEKKLKKLGRWQEYQDRTDDDGMCPSRGAYANIGSGLVKIEARKGLRKSSKEELIKPKEERIIHISLGGSGEDNEHFEPKILSVSPCEDDNSKMVVRGRID